MRRALLAATIKHVDTTRHLGATARRLGLDHEGMQTVGDAALAVGLTLVSWAQLLVLPHMMRPRFRQFGGPAEFIFGGPLHTSPWLYVLVAAAFLPLALRRKAPMTILAITTVVAAAYEAIPHPPSSFTLFAVLIALYTVGTIYDRTRLVWAGAIVTAVTLAATLPPAADRLWLPEFARVIASVFAAAAFGDATRNRRAYTAEVEQRALEAERTREEETARRVDEERLRIARELHDVTAHSLSLIAVQSGAAMHVIDKDPAAARKALEIIRTTSKQSLDELRAMLGVLRGAGDPDTPLAPAPKLSGIADLVRPVEGAGFEVRLDVADDLGDVPAMVEASAYRIVQEALTNVVRHSGAKVVSVRVDRDPAALTVDVTDDGRGASGQGPEGHGIAGMRERAAALGGTFEAGPLPTGGYRVTARLPIQARGV
jgi:signal transduction histidine kinase